MSDAPPATAPRAPWPVRLVLAPLHALERARGRWRLLLFLVYSVVLVVLGALGWRAMSLRGLPDIGDPFDVRAFAEAARVPDDRNAYRLYEQAIARFVRGDVQAQRRDPKAWDVLDWTDAAPEVRAWVEANRPALALWLAGTDKPDALLVPPESMTISTLLGPAQEQRAFARLALLEASRLRFQGDMADAWRCYRGVLRASRHVGRHGGAIQRLIGLALLRLATPGITSWAAEPSLDPALLRAALADLADAERLTPPTSEMFRVEYLTLRNSLDEPDIRKAVVSDAQVAQQSAWNYLPVVPDVLWYFSREPERSRRIIRLVFANWLSQCDKPPNARAPLAETKEPNSLPIYAVDRAAPPAARALAPAELETWLESSWLARYLLPAIGPLSGAIDSDRRHLQVLRLQMTERLYARERGEEPRTLGELVKAGYLDRLPDGFGEYDIPNDASGALAPAQR